MVNVSKGVLLECDPAVKQFVLHLDSTRALGRQFVLEDLDETHLFIAGDVVEKLQEKLDDLMKENSFSFATES